MQRKTVTFKDGHDERAYDLMPEDDELDEDPRPVVVTLKSQGVRLAEPPTEPSTSVISQESKEKLDEEGLFIDMMNNLIYFGNVKVRGKINPISPMIHVLGRIPTSQK